MIINLHKDTIQDQNYSHHQPTLINEQKFSLKFSYKLCPYYYWKWLLHATKQCIDKKIHQGHIYNQNNMSAEKLMQYILERHYENKLYIDAYASYVFHEKIREKIQKVNLVLINIEKTKTTTLK